MQMKIVRDANGEVLAAIDLSDRTGDVPEVILEQGFTRDVVEVRRMEFVDDLDGVLQRLARKG
jgi:hypothetical protein